MQETGTGDMSGWTVLSGPHVVARTGSRPDRGRRAPTGRGLLAGLLVAALVSVVLVLGAAVLVARQIAEAQSVGEVARTAELLGDVIVEPALSNELLDGDPEAVHRLDSLVRDRVIGGAVVRVKIWDPSGRIVYSDEPRLIGQGFELDGEEIETLDDGGVEAEVSDLDAPENQFETGQGELLEAYHGVRTPTGRTLLFEAYFRYDQVLERSQQLWTAFSLLAVASIVVLLVLLAPIARRVFTHLRDTQRQRETLLQHALDASDDERRRIAARLHDGAIQDLTASALVLARAAGRARGSGDTALADELDGAASTARSSVSGLRSLLVDVYPPSLTSSGLGSALDDLATAVRGRGVDVDLVVDDDLGLPPEDDRLVFRMVRECLANVVRHARAARARVVITRGGLLAGPGATDGAVVTVVDDGRGFDPSSLARPASGHIGIPLLAGAAAEAGATLAVRSGPSGTEWRLTLPGRPTPAGSRG